MVRFVEKTPLVDGGGLKNTLENKAPGFLDKKIGDYINARGRKVFFFNDTATTEIYTLFLHDALPI